MEAQGLACAQEKAQREGRNIVFIDESGLSEKCPATQTWAPKGQTPVIQQSFSWKQMSAIGGLTWWRFYFRFYADAIKNAQVIEFRSAIKRQIRNSLLFISGGVGMHKSRRLREWLEEQDGAIAIRFLPPYAPELNRVEAIWAYLKKHEIANLCLTILAEVSEYARKRLRSMQRLSTRVRSFWKQIELAI